MYRILIVEDDAALCSLLSEALKKWDFETDSVTDFSDVEATFQKTMPHLVLMDISLPFYNGYYWCEKIRKYSAVPIVFLSSHTENMDIVMAMNMGGDEYITKPFSSEVLIAKITALLRRSYGELADPQTLVKDGLCIHSADATVSYSGKSCELTKNELRIVMLLLYRKDQIVSREEIMKKLWDSDAFVDDNTLTVNVNRLRKKLSDTFGKDFIQTKKGLGYLLHD